MTNASSNLSLTLINNIPQEITGFERFVGYNSNKMPINLYTGNNASISNPSTWCDFRTAIENMEKFRNAIGMGVVLGNTSLGKLCGIDIDCCIDDEGNIAKEVKEIISEINSYTEYSPSKKGVHILLYAEKKTQICKNTRLGWCKALEVYDFGRYFTLTGDVIYRKSIEYRQKELNKIVDKYLITPKMQNKTRIVANLENEAIKSDEKYFRIGLEKDEYLKILYEGKRPNGNESEDDMALLSKLSFWCNGNENLIKETFLNSPHACSKDENHRKKLCRIDYLDRTLEKISNYDFARQQNENFIRNNKKEDVVQILQTDKLKNLINGISRVNNENDIDWVVENVFARDYVSIFFGEAGSGKTWLILDLAIVLSHGGLLWNNIEVEQAKILLFEGDTPVSMLKERINKLNKTANDNFFSYVSRYQAEEENINLALSTQEGRTNFEEFIKLNKPDLVIVDTLISFIDDEVDAKNVKPIVDFLRIIASKYHIHIIIVHHSRKRESGENRSKLDQSDVIGSSIITRLASIVIGVDKYAE